MKVICAGFSHTGTKSLAEALKILGYTRIHDFLEHAAIDGEYWNRIYDGNGNMEDFKEMYKDVDAVLDVPANIFWEEILQAFPKAKVSKKLTIITWIFPFCVFVYLCGCASFVYRLGLPCSFAPGVKAHFSVSVRGVLVVYHIVQLMHIAGRRDRIYDLR